MKSIAQVLIAFFILALIIKLSGPNKKEIVPPPVIPEGGQTTLDDTPSPPIVKPEIKDSPLLKLHKPYLKTSR